MYVTSNIEDFSKEGVEKKMATLDTARLTAHNHAEPPPSRQAEDYYCAHGAVHAIHARHVRLRNYR